MQPNEPFSPPPNPPSEQNSFNNGWTPPSPDPIQPPQPQSQFSPNHHSPHHPSPAFMRPHHSEPTPDPTPSLEAPKPGSAEYTRDDQPVGVVQVLSVRGLEYWMMFMALWVSAIAVVSVLISLISGNTSFEVLSFPIALLLVSVPLFGFFFLRLKRAEYATPALRYDPSKRRLSQVTQVVAYVASFISLVGIIYSIMAQISGSLDTSLTKIIFDFLVVIVVSGGILAYYWNDEHRRVR